MTEFYVDKKSLRIEPTSSITGTHVYALVLFCLPFNFLKTVTMTLKSYKMDFPHFDIITEPVDSPVERLKNLNCLALKKILRTD